MNIGTCNGRYSLGWTGVAVVATLLIGCIIVVCRDCQVLLSLFLEDTKWLGSVIVLNHVIEMIVLGNSP